MKQGNVYDVQFRKGEPAASPNNVLDNPKDAEKVLVFAESEEGAKNVVLDHHTTEETVVEILSLTTALSGVYAAGDELPTGEQLDADFARHAAVDLPEDGKPVGEFDKTYAPEDTITVDGIGPVQVSTVKVGDTLTDGLVVESITSFKSDGFIVLRMKLPEGSGALPTSTPDLAVGSKVHINLVGEDPAATFTVSGIEPGTPQNVTLEGRDGLFLAADLSPVADDVTGS